MEHRFILTNNDLVNISTGSISTSGYGSLNHGLTIIKRGKVVTVSGYVNCPTVGQYVTVGVISSGFRPKTYMYGICITNYSSVSDWRLSGTFNIGTGGVLRIAVDNTGDLYFSSTYLIS